MSRLDRRPWLWLLIGIALVPLVHLRGSVGILAWVAPIPLLRYLRLTRGVGSRLAVFGALALAWSLAFLEIAEPFPAAAVPMWGVGLALFQVVPYLLHAALARRLPTGLATLVFPAGLALAEWAQHALTPFGSWAATAYTQVDDLPLLQLVSLTGLAGVTFLVGWVAALAEAMLAEPRALRRTALAAATLVVLVHAGGAWRLSASAGEGRPTTLVAAIDTDATTSGLPMPEPAQAAAWDRALAARTERAAAAGARLAVWPEVGSLVRPADEARWLADVAALARRLRIDIVAGYLMPTSLEPLAYDNKYAFARADGTIDHTYHKQNPVPGEPAEPGEGPPRPLATDYGLVSGALCYDYDFPANARARAGVDLVALPSSDWRGIDPIHTQMAALRAIESGHSIVRATRFGLSAGIDPEGRLRGWMSHFDRAGDGAATDGVLVVALPRHGVTTLYALLGDWLVALLGATLVGLTAVATRRARTGRNLACVLDDDGATSAAP